MNNRKSECQPKCSDVTLLCDPALPDQTECTRMLLVLLLKKNLSVRTTTMTLHDDANVTLIRIE